MAAMVFVLIDTWRVGRRVHLEHMRDGTLAARPVPRTRARPTRVAGTAIFLAARTDVTPGPLLHSLKHYKVLHERVVLDLASRSKTSPSCRSSAASRSTSSARASSR